MQQNYWPDVSVLYYPNPVKKVLFLLLILPFNGLFAQVPAGDRDETVYIYRSLKEALVQPEKVYRLVLNRARLDTFPPEILQMTNLQELDLSKNKMEEIPPGIGKLIHLKRLNLSNNKLVHLPEEIGQLKELEFLGLNRNELEDLPATIGELSNLEVLELWDNELNSIPDEISQLGNLRLLELRGILFSEEEQRRIDSLVVKSAKIHMSPSCNCKD
jgi:Leucine-rich repeat (LRR) protein